MPQIGPLQAGWKSDTGHLREHNEDAYLVPNMQDSRIAARGYLFAVADGMGGYGGGQEASSASLHTLYQHYYTATTSHETALERAIQAANMEVRRRSLAPNRDVRMGTTLVAALFYEQHILVAHIGDSRAYMLRQGDMQQITHDHSNVQEQVAAGLLSPAAARTATGKHVLTRSLGSAPAAHADYTPVSGLHVGDILLLCTDGVTNLVADHELAHILLHLHPEAAAERLVELANERGGSDNSTVQVIRIDALPFVAPPETAQSLHRITQRLPGIRTAFSGQAATGMPWLLVVGVLLLVVVLLGVLLVVVAVRL